MKFIIIALFLSLFFPSPGMGQSSSGSVPIASPGKRSVNLSKQPGIRFVLRNREGSTASDFFMQIDQKKFVPVDFRLGLPGRRVAIPKTNRLRLFDKEPTPEMLKKGIKPILDVPVPSGMGERLIGMVGYGARGYEIHFIDETGMKPGLVHFVNLTSKNYLVDAPKAPGSEQKRFDLKSGQQYSFGKALPPNYMDPIPFRIYHQMMVNGQPQWIVERRSMMNIGKTRSTIFVLMPDASGTSMITHEIMVYAGT